MSSKQVLVDSDAWVGYYLSNDALHKRAVAGFEQLEKANYVPTINSQIIGEVATVLSHKSGQKIVQSFISDIENSGITIMYVDKKLHDVAMKLFLKIKFKGISYVDCINVAVIRETGIESIFAYDKFYHKQFSITNLAYPQY